MAQTYTTLKEGQAPAFGTSGQAVKDLQNTLNTQNTGKAGWTPLATDGLFGPKTQAAMNFNPNPNNLILTSSTPRREFVQNSLALNNALSAFDVNGNTASNQANQVQPNVNGVPNSNQNNDNASLDIATYSDPYTQQLDKMKVNADAATKNLISTIQATRSGRENEVNKEMDRYKSGLQLLGIQSGNIQSSPDIVMGHIQQAENARVAKLQELDREEATALLEAQSARDERDFKTLKEKMDYIKTLKKDRIDTIKNSYDNIKAEQGIAETKATQIYDVLQTLNPGDKEVFLQKVASKFNIPVGALVSSVSQVGVKRQQENIKTQSAQAPAKSSGVTKKTGSSGSGKPTVSEFNKLLQSATGSDGKVDPDYWSYLQNEWMTRNGSNSSFTSNFKKYVNPLSYEKTGLSTPKQSASSGI